MHQGVYGPSQDLVLVRILLVSQKSGFHLVSRLASTLLRRGFGGQALELEGSNPKKSHYCTSQFKPGLAPGSDKQKKEGRKNASDMVDSTVGVDLDAIDITRPSGLAQRGAGPEGGGRAGNPQ